VLLADSGKLRGAESVLLSVQPNPEAALIEERSFVSGASFEGGRTRAPGEFVSIFGSNLAGDVSMTVNGKPVPLVSVTQTQINAVLPFGLEANRRHEVYLRRGTFEMGPLSQPAVFTRDQSGKGQGIVLDAQYRYFDSSNPGRAGDPFIVYAAGLGEVDPPVPAGTVSPTSTLSRVKGAVKVTIGGVQVKDLQFAGLAPGLMSGVYQLVGVIPPGVPVGSAVPVVISVDQIDSPAVTMAIRQ
jgi:uncharacterized protein (TIGR03437 family)